MALPSELEVLHGDGTILVRFDADRGEEQWFDARAGVGSPGYPPSVEITEVNLGAGWTTPDAHPELDLDALADQVMEKLGEAEEADNAAQTESEYQAWQESKTITLEQP